MLPQVYVASKTRHAAMWQAFRRGTTVPDPNNPGKDFLVPPWRIRSSWIDEAGQGESEMHGPNALWPRIQEEIMMSHGLVFYADRSDFGTLKGAFIEAGMAMMAGMPVVVWIPGVDLEERSYRPLGSWVTHPAVVEVYKGYDPQQVWQTLDMWNMRRGR